jgi:tRNA-guanine family transglycosylase
LAKELLAGTLLSIHNLHALIQMVSDLRESIIEEKFNRLAPSLLTRWANNASK